MYVVIVSIRVKPDKVQDFRTAILDNTINTRKEPGNVRFDVLQGEEDPARFQLYEVYKSKDDFAAHQKTPHYIRWRDTVTDWMVEPRTSTKNAPIFFGDSTV